ncbi:MFS transporter [Pseudoalteromonas luteoviolacea]|uniref:MFS transporter n=1 Tax=Pseudoalteromonas luteoviolacea TaxID=43657 RepID=UPI001EEE43F4|nr:MFS transporter [Pseudoalteromonas luteoviolacea]MCF6442997.1 MFS transporter [Pseudoalteromonas luteoviolacea]
MRQLNEDTPDKQPLRLYFAVAFIAMSGLSYINFLPGLMNALANGLGHTESQAGQVVALNGYGALFGTALAILSVKNIHWKPTIISAMSVLLLLELTTPAIINFDALLVLRFAAGFAGGLAVGVSFSVLAKMYNTNRAFGFLLFIQFIIGALVMYTLPQLELNFGAYAVFYVMATIAALSILMAKSIPAGRFATNNKSQESHTRVRSLGLSITIMLVIFIYLTAASALYAYVGLIGMKANLNETQVSTYIAFTGLLGLLGAVIPMIQAPFVKRRPLTIISVSLCLVAVLVLLQPTISINAYIVALALFFFAWPAVQSFLFAAIADISPSGRLSTISSLVSSIAMASGPMLAAFLIKPSDYSLMLTLCASLFALCAVILYMPLKTAPPAKGQSTPTLTTQTKQ